MDSALDGEVPGPSLPINEVAEEQTDRGRGLIHPDPMCTYLEIEKSSLLMG